MQTQLLTGELEKEAEKAQEVAGAFKRGRPQRTASDITLQVYPNPFNPSATIVVEGAKGGRTVVEVFNLLGERVSQLFDGESTSGQLRLTLDGSNLASGSYLVRVMADGSVATRRVELKK